MGAFNPVHWLIVVVIVGVPAWLLSMLFRRSPPREVSAPRPRAARAAQANDPYAPPQAYDEESDASEPALLPIAGHGARFVNSIIDITIVSLLSHGSQSLVVQLLVMLGYYWILETVFGTTLGKLVTGTRVVAAAGGNASAWQILGRTLSRMVPLEVLSFIGSDAVGWHDRWSGTRVIRR